MEAITNRLGEYWLKHPVPKKNMEAMRYKRSGGTAWKSKGTRSLLTSRRALVKKRYPRNAPCLTDNVYRYTFNGWQDVSMARKDSRGYTFLRY